MKIYFVRHAQPDISVHDDLLRPLTAQGKIDSKRVTESLLGKNISQVYSSPYIRAIDTVKDFAILAGLEIVIEDDLRERKVSDGWIDDFNSFTKNQWSDYNYKLPEGESLSDVQQRSVRVIKQLIDKHPDENIAIGTHGTSLSTILNYFNPEFDYEYFIKIKDVMPLIVELVIERGTVQSIMHI